MKNKHLIMIVEDEEAIIEFISVKLELQGYRTLKAVNGQEALSRFLTKLFPSIRVVIILGWREECAIINPPKNHHFIKQ